MTVTALADAPDGFIPPIGETAAPVRSSVSAPALRDLLEDGIYLLFLLREGNAPNDCKEFNHRVDRFLLDYEKQAKNFAKPSEEIEQAKYAFCALTDEIMLSSDFPLHGEWARMPLQLRLFGEHFGGEGFFERLETLRVEPDKHIEALEVFHSCLLLGFRGKYLIAGAEKLDALIYRVGKEIRQVRGDAPEFAPHGKLPRRVQNYLRHEMSMWLFFGLIAAAAAGVFIVLRLLLDARVARLLGG
ncbi:MAG: type IVB secretion system protein IcmH/DotU [Azoarcus sp.]|jgi:type VI secretion system protein ImpK|nr:type IVB secretion system protein IcmH/DotU [Azoarcus sp.]